MTEQEIKDIYLSAEKTLSVLNTPMGRQIAETNKEIVQSAMNVIEKYKDQYKEILLREKQDANVILKETEEAIEALKFIPETSYEAVSELNSLITKNSEVIQNKLSFDSSVFYDKYFLNLPSKIKEEVVDIDFITNNERFKEWFGNSKVVDKNGKPMIVYHGSGGRVDEFSVFKFNLFPGNYFAENKSYAEWFSTYRGGTNLLFKCFLRVQNPIDLTELYLDNVKYEDFVIYIKLKYGYTLPENKMLKAYSDANGGMWAWRYLRMGVDWLKHIASKNEFDGFHYYENNPDNLVNGKDNVTPAWLVFRENQIKAADERNTTFSLFAKDIKMNKGGSL
jgi:hypothetical protein